MCPMVVPPDLTAAQAAALLPPGGRAFLAGCASEPTAILNAVRDDPSLWRGVILTGAFIPGVNDWDFSALGQETKVETIFATSGLLNPAGTVAHLPMHYSQFWRRLGQPGFVDVVFLTIPPPRGDGTTGFGLACDFAPSPIAAGAKVVGIINPHMPDAPNGPRLPLERFAGLVLAQDPLPTYDPGPIGADVAQIATHIVGLLREGDTLQLGLGKVQTAVLETLARSSLSGLGFHAGMISPALLEPLRREVFSRGVVTGVALGDAKFYAAVAGLPGLVFAPVGHTHDPGVLARTPSFVSVNSVIEIDLFGQSNAEALDGRQVSGQGGLLDFHRAAREQAGGRAVLALASTAKGGSTSRIVPRLPMGTPVSVARADVDIVVTEHGMAHLGGLSLTERAHALISLADPRHRDMLREGLDDSRKIGR